MAMDVVSDAIAAVRAGHPQVARTHRKAPWGLRFPPSTGPDFHVVLQGSCWLLPGGGEQAIPLGTGDVVLVAHDSTVALADDPSTPSVLATRELDDAWQPRASSETGPATTVLMCGSY